MVTASAGSALAVAAVGTLLTLAVVAAAATLAVRAAVRRWRLLRVVVARRALAATQQATSPTWWVAQRTRRRLWVAVTGAERAIADAQRAGAPVGEFPLLCRQLRHTAGLADAQLRAAGRSSGPVPAEVLGQAAQVTATAEEMHSAVSAAVADTLQPHLTPLVDAVRRECEALAAGTRAARRLG